MIETWKNKIKHKKLGLLISGIGFCFGIILSVNQNPNIARDIDFFPAFLVILIGVPFTILLNAFEYKLMGKLHFKTIPLSNAIEICILASAANLLPVPGGAITRIVSLNNSGISYSKATLTNILFGLIWLAISLIVTGLGLLSFSQKYLGWIFSLFGIILLTCTILKMIVHGASFNIIVYIIFQRFALIFIDILRIWGCLFAFGYEATISQTTIFSLGGVLGSAVSVVPAGLGIREAISAGLAPFVGLSATIGFLITALNRLLGLSLLAPSAFLLLCLKKNSNAITLK